jgi:uncharacterized protein
MIVERAVAVPMRDGAVLRADIYRPDSGAPAPTVLHRTCYNRSFQLTPRAGLDPERAVQAGLVLICQDVRGRYESGGDFYPFAREGADGFDTIEWIASQPWCSGAVGLAGRSYPAAVQWMAAAERPPHLKAIVPMLIGSSFYHGWVYQGGAFQLGFNLFWISLMSEGKPRPPLREQFSHLPLTDPPLLQNNPAARYYHDWIAHWTDDGYWRALSPRGRYGMVDIPVYSVTGWYDVFLGGALENFGHLRHDARSQSTRDAARILIGPWSHGSAWGTYPDHRFEVFGSDQDVDLDELQLDFFGRHLGGAGPSGDEAPVRIFVMGSNCWREEDDWPLARAHEERWHLRSGGALSPESPPDEPPDRYHYDPADPAPTIGGPTSLPARFMRTNSGPLDQAPLESREDVLVYSSAALERPLEVTGPLSFVLHAASSASDTDFVIKLCDVDPDGFSRILAEGILRARFREGFEHPKPLESDVPSRYDIDLVATSNVFLAGHRIRILVTSSSFPRFDRNTGTGNPLGVDTEADLRPADQTVFHDAQRPSYVVLPVVS